MTLSIFLIILSYLIGSICSAVIVCKSCSLPDPRQEGSKNPGATNVLRLAGKNYAALVLVADILKGVLPVLIARACNADSLTVALTALAAVAGHVFPIFFGFKGGKGVATAIGALLAFHFIVGVMVIATWLIIAKFSRHSSLASIISITLAPFYCLMVVGHIETFPPLLTIAILVLFKHRQNISRLVDGTEPTIILKDNVIENYIEHSDTDNPHEIPVQSKAAKKHEVKPTKNTDSHTKDASLSEAKKTSTHPKSPAKKEPVKKAKPQVAAKKAESKKESKKD